MDITKLPPHLQDFVKANWEKFDRAAWEQTALNQHAVLKKSMADLGFTSLPDMMEAAFNNCSWQYRNFLLRYCWSARGEQEGSNTVNFT